MHTGQWFDFCDLFINSGMKKTNPSTKKKKVIGGHAPLGSAQMDADDLAHEKLGHGTADSQLEDPDDLAHQPPPDEPEEEDDDDEIVPRTKGGL
jgi:hypothetical protein